MEKTMSAILITVAAVVGIGAGAFTIHKIKQKTIDKLIEDNAEIVIPPPTIIMQEDKQGEVQIQLSDLDIVKLPCSEAYILQNGDGLCREMFCWAQTNSTTGGTPATSCDAISNINNSKSILATCNAVEPDLRTSCLQLFRERK